MRCYFWYIKKIKLYAFTVTSIQAHLHLSLISFYFISSLTYSSTSLKFRNQNLKLISRLRFQFKNHRFWLLFWSASFNSILLIRFHGFSGGFSQFWNFGIWTGPWFQKWRFRFHLNLTVSVRINYYFLRPVIGVLFSYYTSFKKCKEK